MFLQRRCYVERFCRYHAGETSIVEDAARVLKCKPTEVFAKAAIAKGYIAYNQQAEKWISHYVEQYLAEEVVDFCLSVLTEHKEVVH